MPMVALWFLKMLGGKLSKPLEYGVGIAVALGIALAAVHAHDNKIISDVQNQYVVAAAKAQQEQAELVTSTLDRVQNLTTEQLSSLAKVNRSIDNAPVTKNCIQNPAIRAALGLPSSVREPAPASRASTTSPAASAPNATDLQGLARYIEDRHRHGSGALPR